MIEALLGFSFDDWNRGELIFTAPLSAELVAALAILAWLGSLIVLARRWQHIGLARLIPVAVLQAAMFAVLAFVLLLPAIETRELRGDTNTVALLLDGSASMSTDDGVPRIAIAREALANISQILTDNELDAMRYRIDEDVEEVTDFNVVVADANASDLAAGLEAVLDRARRQSLAAVVLVSDGADTEGGIPSESLALLAEYNVPIHTVGVGRDAMPEDLELSHVSVPATTQPSATVPVRVAIRHDAPGTAKLRIYDGDQLAAVETIELADNITVTSRTLDVPIDDIGYHRLRVEISGADDEPQQDNNRFETMLSVEERTYRVLYYEGEPRWEYKFLRRAVEGEAALNVSTLLQVSPNKFYRQGISGPDELADGLPADRATLFEYDAVILGSVEAASFSRQQMESLRAFVSERGGSLLFLAGRMGLGNGGWGQSSITDLLPVSLPPSDAKSFVRSKASVELTPQGADWPPLRFADDDADNAVAWNGLPEIADYQRLGPLKPAARALLTVRTDDGSQPLFVTQPFGRGLVAVLATGGTWRWQMSLPVEDDRHERFWRQILRALVATAPQRSSLTAKRQSGNAIELRAEMRDEAFAPNSSAAPRVLATNESGATRIFDLLPVADESGVYSASASLDASGSWYFESVSPDDEANILRSGLYLDADRREQFSLRKNEPLLRRIADVTGGQYFEPDNLDALPEILRYSSAGVSERIVRPIWDAPAWFLLLLFAKVSEWLLRRRWRTI